MEFVNDAYKWESMPHSVSTIFVQLLNPYAPHMAEELWERLGNGPSVSESEWPKFDEQYLVEDSVTVAVQVNGKVYSTQTHPHPPTPTHPHVKIVHMFSSKFMECVE